MSPEDPKGPPRGAASPAGLARALRHAGGATAVRWADAHWRYADLAARAAARAAALSRQGLAAGELVAVAVRPALDFLVMQYALARCGAALLPLPETTRAGGIRPLLRQCGAEWRWVPAARGAGRLRRTDAPAPGRGAVTDLAAVVATSGTTGMPKAVMLTGRNLLASAALVNARLELGRDDGWLCCLPRTHIGGLSIAYRCALAGAAMVLHERFDPGTVHADLERYALTHVSLVPPMLARLLELGRAVPDTLRVCLVGGQALSGELASRALDAGWPVHVTYGLTETASQVAAGQLRRKIVAGTVGEVLPGVRVQAVRCDEGVAPMRISGDIVMAGYASPTRAPGLGLENGGFTAPDLGCCNDEGQLRILGRADEALVVAGHTVFPALVEQCLARIRGVSEVVVVGFADEVWGHRLVAAYAGSLDPEAMARWCRGHLPSQERPREFRRFRRLPLTPSGKHDRAAIRAALLAGEEPTDDGGV